MEKPRSDDALFTNEVQLDIMARVFLEGATELGFTRLDAEEALVLAERTLRGDAAAVNHRAQRLADAPSKAHNE